MFKLDDEPTNADDPVTVLKPEGALPLSRTPSSHELGARVPSAPHHSAPLKPHEIFGPTQLAPRRSGTLAPPPFIPDSRLSAPQGQAQWPVPMVSQHDTYRTHVAAPAPKRSPLLLLGIGAIVALGALALVVIVVRTPRKSDGAAPTAAASAGPSPVAPLPPEATISAQAATASTEARPASGPEEMAQAALAKLKDGLATCVKNTIHVLPGTSPAVPDSLAWLKKGPYKSLRRDWAAPFFSCTGFKVDEPMPFVIQWQIDEANLRGTGIAWVDANGDGKAEKIYGFSAKLTQRDVVELGPIEQLPEGRKIQRGR